MISSHSLQKKIEDYPFPHGHDALIHHSMAAAGGPPLRDPNALLNAMARLEIGLPYGLESLPLLATMCGLQWRRELFPMSGGNFRKMVAAVYVTSAIETGEIEPEVLARAERAAEVFPCSYGDSQALSFLRGQAGVLDEHNDHHDDSASDNKESDDHHDAHASPFASASPDNNNKKKTPPKPDADSSSPGLTRNRSVRFLNAIPIAPVVQAESPSSSSSDSDYDFDAQNASIATASPASDLSSFRFGGTSSSSPGGGRGDTSALRDELYRSAHTEKEETEQIMRHLFTVPRPIQRKRRQSNATDGKDSKETDSKEQQQKEQAPPSPTAVCFSADKVGTFFEGFGINPRGMLRFFQNPDELETMVKRATSASSMRRRRSFQFGSGVGGLASQPSDVSALDGGGAAATAGGMMQHSATSPAFSNAGSGFDGAPFTPSRQLTMGGGGTTSENSTISESNNNNNNGSTSSPVMPLVPSALGSEGPQSSMAWANTSSPAGGTMSTTSALERKASFVSVDGTNSAKSAKHHHKDKDPAKAVFDVEVPDLSWWLNTRPQSSSAEAYNTPRTADRARHRWRVAIFAILQTVRATSRGLDGNASCMDLLGGGKDKEGFVGFARALFNFTRENRLESTALKDKLTDISRDHEERHGRYAKLERIPKQPELGNVDGVLEQMKKDRTSVDMMLRRLSVPCVGESGTAELAKQIVQHRVHRHATDAALVVRVPTREQMHALKEKMESREDHGCGANAAGVRAMMRQELQQKSLVVERLLSRGPKGQQQQGDGDDEDEDGHRRSRPASAALTRQQQAASAERLSRPIQPRQSSSGRGATPEPNKPQQRGASAGATRSLSTGRQQQHQQQLQSRPSSSSASRRRGNTNNRPMSAMALRRAVAEAMKPLEPENPYKEEEEEKERKKKREAAEKKSSIKNKGKKTEEEQPQQQIEDKKEQRDVSSSTISSWMSSSSSPSTSPEHTPERGEGDDHKTEETEPKQQQELPPRPMTAGLPPRAPKSLDTSVNSEHPPQHDDADDAELDTDYDASFNGTRTWTIQQHQQHAENQQQQQHQQLSPAMERWIGRVDPISSPPPPQQQTTSSASAPPPLAAGSPAAHRNAEAIRALRQQSAQRHLERQQQRRHQDGEPHMRRNTLASAGPGAIPDSSSSSAADASPSSSLNASVRHVRPLSATANSRSGSAGRAGAAAATPSSQRAGTPDRRTSPPRLSPRDDFASDRPCRTRAKLEAIISAEHQHDDKTAAAISDSDDPLFAPHGRVSAEKRLAAEAELRRDVNVEVYSSRNSVLKKIGAAKFGAVENLYAQHIVRRKL